MEIKDLEKEILLKYRKTQAYKKNRDLLIYDIDNWPEFLQKRVKETRGNLSKEEKVFWLAFLTEEPKRLKTWGKYCREHGFLEQRENAEDSLPLIDIVLKKRVNDNMQQVEKIIKQTETGQTAPEPQQGSLEYYCEKAVEKGYLRKEGNGYRRIYWSKAQLAYFLGQFLIDGRFPDDKYCKMFGESRLAKAADQLKLNKLGDGKPRGYEKIDELLQE